MCGHAGVWACACWCDTNVHMHFFPTFMITCCCVNNIYVLKFLLVMFVEEKAGFDIVPVFISVDPERDTVEQVREYVKGAS